MSCLQHFLSPHIKQSWYFSTPSEIFRGTTKLCLIKFKPNSLYSSNCLCVSRDGLVKKDAAINKKQTCLITCNTEEDLPRRNPSRSGEGALERKGFALCLTKKSLFGWHNYVRAELTDLFEANTGGLTESRKISTWVASLSLASVTTSRFCRIADLDLYQYPPITWKNLIRKNRKNTLSNN